MKEVIRKRRKAFLLVVSSAAVGKKVVGEWCVRVSERASDEPSERVSEETNSSRGRTLIFNPNYSRQNIILISA